MKATLLTLLTAASLTYTFGAATTAVAAEPPAKAGAGAPKAASEAKTIPMHSRADVIDLTARTFTNKRKDGVAVKHTLTPATEIKQEGAAARLEDIKVGDYVSGSRKKVSDTEYTVIKITKFGPKAEKKESAAPAKAPAEAKPKAN